MGRKCAEMGGLLLWNTEIGVFCNVEIAIGFLRKRLIVPKDDWSECGKNEKNKGRHGRSQ